MIKVVIEDKLTRKRNVQLSGDSSIFDLMSLFSLLSATLKYRISCL